MSLKAVYSIDLKMKLDYSNLLFGLLFLLLGLLHYLIFRDVSILLMSELPGMPWLMEQFTTFSFPYDGKIHNHIPSFIHVLALSYLTLGIVKLKEKLVIPIFWFFVNLCFEFGQTLTSDTFFYIGTGTFDWWDILSSLIAMMIVGLHIIIGERPFNDKDNDEAVSVLYPRFAKRILLSMVFVAGISSIVGSYQICGQEDSSESQSTLGCYPASTQYEPVYLTYDELRSSVSTNQTQLLDKVGKIYLYENYLLINSRNKGVFIYDNQDPNDPVLITFITIPGNIDIAIKNSYLYVDSYIDLVVIDFSDINNIREVDRINNVFPYDAYQNLPPDIYLNYNKEKGVVIGYKEISNDK